MNRHLRSCPARAALVGAALLLLPAAGPAQQKEPAEHMIRLKHMDAAQAARLVQDLMGDLVGPRARVRMAADVATNSVLLRGDAADLAKVARLLERIDVPGRPPPIIADAPAIRVFPLGRLKADKHLAESLRLVLSPPYRFAVLPEERSILVYAPPETLARVEALLLSLMKESPSPAADPPVRVRVFWVVAGTPDEKAGELPASLQELAGELQALGVARARPAAQLAANVTPGTPFEVGGSARLNSPYRLALTGTLSTTTGAAELDATLTIREGADRRAGHPDRLRTRLTVPVGRPVVLGALPVDGRPSAFVALVGTAPQARKPAAKAAKKISVHFERKPWASVLKWWSDQAHVPLVATSYPAGTFTFVPPQTDGRPRTYTLGEAFDILNGALQKEKCLLIRNKRAYGLVAADERIDPSLIRTVRPADLAGLPKTDLVLVVVPLKDLTAEDAAREVRKLLTPFGQVHEVPESNHLILTDTAGNLRNVLGVLRQIDGKAGAGHP